MEISLNTKVDLNHKTFTTQNLTNLFEKFLATINDDKYGFFHLTDDSSQIIQAKEVFNKYKERKHFIQIGIGGSALGPQMLVEAIGNNKDTNFIWLDNTDADYIHDELKKIEPKESLFYVVSKSGSTAETMAAFSICRTVLVESGVNENEFHNYFVFCTDPQKSELKDLANELGHDSLCIPSNIGGRFSVLTAVGLLPALFANIDIDKLFQGANEIKKEILNENLDKNQLIQTAAQLYYLFDEKKVTQTVMMPYSSKLKSFSHWFVQLWAESLGKFSDKKNTNTGLTPIAAYGATDQHSQMQLFMEGQNDKFLFLIEVLNKKHDYQLDNTIPKPSAKRLNGHTLNELIQAQLHGTIKALNDRDRSFGLIKIKQNDEKSLGALIMYFESLTALMGHYLEVDPFNQPGVELGKKYAYEYLKNKHR